MKYGFEDENLLLFERFGVDAVVGTSNYFSNNYEILE